MGPHYYVLVLLLPLPVLAGRPLVTDDAGLTEAKACQVEFWTQRTDAVHEYWVLPACNPFGNFEIAAGGTRFHMDDGNWQSSYLKARPSLNTLLRTAMALDWHLED